MSFDSWSLICRSIFISFLVEDKEYWGWVGACNGLVLFSTGADTSTSVMYCIYGDLNYVAQMNDDLKTIKCAKSRSILQNNDIICIYLNKYGYLKALPFVPFPVISRSSL